MKKEKNEDYFPQPKKSRQINLKQYSSAQHPSDRYIPSSAKSSVNTSASKLKPIGAIS